MVFSIFQSMSPDATCTDPLTVGKWQHNSTPSTLSKGDARNLQQSPTCSMRKAFLIHVVLCCFYWKADCGMRQRRTPHVSWMLKLRLTENIINKLASINPYWSIRIIFTKLGLSFATLHNIIKYHNFVRIVYNFIIQYFGVLFDMVAISYLIRSWKY